MIKVGGQAFLNFSSNDYLGQSQCPEVMQAWVEGVAKFGAGSGASPLVTGRSSAHDQLEAYLASGLQRDAVLLFSSGFTANQALCQAFGQANVNLIADKLSHASMIDGALMGRSNGAIFKRFKHNDVSHLETLLASSTGDKLVMTEGVFSMDGDQAPLSQIVTLCQANQAWLMLDDAHGFGVLGESGLGCAEAFSLSQDDVPILMGTFGKAIGTGGAFVAASQAVIDYLIQTCRHYIYSTMLPPAQAIATLASLQHIEKTPELRTRLQNNIQLFRCLAKQADLPLLDSNTAIQPVMINNTEQLLIAHQRLKKLGLWVGAIRPPTVPVGSDRLRITLSALHQEQDIRSLVDGLSIVLQNVNKRDVKK